MCAKRQGPQSAHAFTRLDLIAGAGAVMLLLAVALPALAANRAGANRATCVNNLSRIGRAFSMWSSDHGQRFPSQVNYPDGLLNWQDSSRAAAWFQFSYVSNELATPAILACPADLNVAPARQFSGNELDALSHRGDRAISYFLAHPRVEEGRTILAGDRNIVGSIGSQSCPYFISAFACESSPLASGPTWSASQHVLAGNLAFVDGSVEQTDNAGLHANVAIPNSDHGVWHFLPPQPF
jgi:prepilin-type processing-associated H-X9-DG protein